jgi:hypothetical protein
MIYIYLQRFMIDMYIINILDGRPIGKGNVARAIA